MRGHSSAWRPCKPVLQMIVRKWWLSFPGVITWWEGKPTPFTDEFTQCVERCIKAGYEPDKPGAWESYISNVRRD